MMDVVLERDRPVTVPRKADRMPVVRTIYYTLDISTGFLARMVFGKGSIAAADALIDTYWRRIFKSGNCLLQR
ncbi:MAG TPA: hypothetical protein VGO62_01400, partial [Myxococcota bacterium]